MLDDIQPASSDEDGAFRLRAGGRADGAKAWRKRTRMKADTPRITNRRGMGSEEGNEMPIVGGMSAVRGGVVRAYALAAEL